MSEMKQVTLLSPVPSPIPYVLCLKCPWLIPQNSFCRMIISLWQSSQNFTIACWLFKQIHCWALTHTSDRTAKQQLVRWSVDEVNISTLPQFSSLFEASLAAAYLGFQLPKNCYFLVSMYSHQPHDTQSTYLSLQGQGKPVKASSNGP